MAWEYLDEELPPPVECEPTVRTSDGEMTFSELGVEIGGTLPKDQIWTKISRESHEIHYPETAIPEFDIVVEKIDTVTFAMGDKTLKLIFTGW